MTSLDISNCSEIEHLSLSYIDIPILDISQNQKIQELTLGFLDSLEKICVWELPFPDSIVVNFTGCSAPFIICE